MVGKFYDWKKREYAYSGENDSPIKMN